MASAAANIGVVVVGESPTKEKAEEVPSLPSPNSFVMAAMLKENQEMLEKLYDDFDEMEETFNNVLSQFKLAIFQWKEHTKNLYRRAGVSQLWEEEEKEEQQESEQEEKKARSKKKRAIVDAPLQSKRPKHVAPQPIVQDAPVVIPSSAVRIHGGGTSNTQSTPKEHKPPARHLPFGDS